MNDKIVYIQTPSIRTFFNLSVITCILLIGFSVFYYFVVFIPSKEKTKQELETHRKEQLQDCLSQAYDSYEKNWNEVCKIYNKEEKCNLSNSQSQRAEDRYKESKADCFKLYSQ
ncbi:MAG: hypothetical protein HY429_00755 [Candidatus Levybacteria bacterium]|nr:hypothetical protein [Candidatus Levybacteria bacterium]